MEDEFLKFLEEETTESLKRIKHVYLLAKEGNNYNAHLVGMMDGEARADKIIKELREAINDVIPFAAYAYERGIEGADVVGKNLEKLIKKYNV